MAYRSTQYAKIAAALESLGGPMTVAELHGGFCGLLCTGGPDAASAWLGQCVSEIDTELSIAEEVSGVFRFMALDTRNALASADLEFTPILPEDDASLEDRVSELRLWCYGFLSGLGLGGLQLSEETLSKSTDEDAENPVVEIVKDFVALSRAGLSVAERNNPDDTNFDVAEIVEYLRVSVQIMFEDAHDVRNCERALPVSLSEH